MASAKRSGRITFYVIAIAAAALVASLMLVACNGGFNPKTDIPGINSNAVLTIENNKLSFALGMKDIDSADIISKCGCVLTDDEGHEVAVTRDMLDDGRISYEDFDIETVGKDKQITVSYKNASNYIFYDVCDYTVDFYRDEQCEDIWKSVKAQAQLTDDLALAVYADIFNYNYSTDDEVRQADEYGASHFNGWYDNEGSSVTGRCALAVSSDTSYKLELHAHYLSDEQYSDLQLDYDYTGRRVFSGYNGVEPAVDIPEGVTYINLAQIFKSSPDATPIGFEVMNVPSTARLDVPLTGIVNTAGLCEINVDAGSPYYSSFKGGLYSKDYKTLHFLPASYSDIEFHENLETFGRYSCAFWQCRAFTIPDGVKKLDDYCFYRSELTRVEGYTGIDQGVGVFFGTKIPEMNITDGIATYIYLGKTDGGDAYSLSSVTDKSVTEYTVKEGTVSISDNAFRDCKALRSVDLGNMLTRVGNSAFSGCTALESISFPASVERFGSYVFYNCSSLTSVDMSALKEMAYVYDTGVFDDMLPNSFFRGCASLENVELPLFIETVGSSAFYGCNKLKTVNLAELNLKTIMSSAFFGAGTDSESFAVVLPDTVTSLGKQAFSHSGITSINLEQCTALTEFADERTFEYCERLASIEIPDGITAIPGYTFYYAIGLESIDLNNVTKISSYAFSYSGLKSIDLGKVTSIPSAAFSYCSALESVRLTDSVTSVTGLAFRNCANLRTVELGKNTKTFGTYNFVGSTEVFNQGYSATFTCPSLEKIIVPEENEYFSSTDDGILYGRFIGKKDYGDCGVLYIVPASNGITELTLPSTVKVTLPYSVELHKTLNSVVMNDGVENIGKATFYSSNALKRTNIPASVTLLGANIFLGCGALEEVDLDEGNTVYNTPHGNLIYETASDTLVIYTGASDTVDIAEGTLAIDTAVFMSNAKVKSITIPASVTKIGSKAFDGCTSLSYIKLGAGVKDIAVDAFASLKSLSTIVVDPANLYFKSENNILYSKDGKKLWLSAVDNGLTDINEIASGVEEIGNYAFAYHKTLKTVKLPAGVKTIGNYAFYNCRALEVFYGSRELEKIGDHAFGAANETNNPTGDTRYNDSLKTVLLYGNITNFGNNTFYGQFGIEKAFFVMTYEEQVAMTNGKTNSVYLTTGCPDPLGPGYVNNNGEGVHRYINSDLQPIDSPEFYDYFHMVDGEPVIWETVSAEFLR